MTIQMIYEINNTYMAIDGSEIEPVEDYRHKMLQNNKIKNILTPEIRLIDNKKLYYIDVSGKESVLTKFGTRLADRQEIKALFEGIYCVTENASKYLISESDIVFRPELIFRNPVSKEYEFLAVPFKEACMGKEGMTELLQFLMANLDNGDEKLVNAIYGIHAMYSEGNPRFSIAFEYFLNETKEEPEPIINEPKESETFSNNLVLKRPKYVPGALELAAVLLCGGGLTLLGINLYQAMLIV